MNKPILIDKDVLKKIIYKNYKKSNFYQKSVFNLKTFVSKNYFYLLFLIFVGVIVYLNYKKEKYTNKDNLADSAQPININELEEETYGVKNNSKLSENDYMFKYGGQKRVTPIPKRNL